MPVQSRKAYPFKTRQARSAGLTLLELLTVVVVLAIVATMLMPAISAMAERMERSKCTMNLRALHIGAEFYLQDQKHWPQISAEYINNGTDEYARRWIEALKPYKVSENVWRCPTVEKKLPPTDKSKTGEQKRIDYYPTPFDSKQVTPHRWAGQPWFIERGAVHDSGNLMIFQDGSIKSFDEIVAKPKKK
jgi:prepilin-type N-terminal cleavage/methylation domain-containing protein